MFKVFLPALALLLAVAEAVAAVRIEAVALMKDAAMLRIDGRQQLLRVGQRSPQGVLLVSADPRRAVVEAEGKRSELTLSQRIAGTFEETAQTEIQIQRNQAHQYITTAEINGRRTTVLVDTGANTMALSSSHAAALGIDYRKGEPIQVGTAGGVRQGYSVLLDRVSVGGIAVSHVPASVVEGDFPHVVLLGISYLRHVGMREENGIMYLRKKY